MSERTMRSGRVVEFAVDDQDMEATRARAPEGPVARFRDSNGYRSQVLKEGFHTLRLTVCRKQKRETGPPRQYGPVTVKCVRVKKRLWRDASEKKIFLSFCPPPRKSLLCA